MEKQSFLSRLKNKWLLLYLALLIPALTFTGVNQVKKAEVKGVQTVVSVVPTIIPTETPIPTSLPTSTETPTPTRTPTNTPQPTRVYILPTKVYSPQRKHQQQNNQQVNWIITIITQILKEIPFTPLPIPLTGQPLQEQRRGVLMARIALVSPGEVPARIMVVSHRGYNAGVIYGDE